MGQMNIRDSGSQEKEKNRYTVIVVIKFQTKQHCQCNVCHGHWTVV